jgi:hypothetical protein
MTTAKIEVINGVPYPNVSDPTSLNDWISSIKRHVEIRSIVSSSLTTNPYREVLKFAYFHDDETKTQATALVCQQMAMTLFSHLIKAPDARIVWRIKPEFDVSLDTIPSDLSQYLTRKQIDKLLPDLTNRPVSLDEVKKALGKEDWASDFCTDSIFPVAAPSGKWCIFKSYMRYAVFLRDEVISHPFEHLRSA